MDLDDLGSTKVGSDMDVVVTSWNLLKWNSMLIVLIIACIVLKPLFQDVSFSWQSESVIHCSWKCGWGFDLIFKKVEISNTFPMQYLPWIYLIDLALHVYLKFYWKLSHLFILLCKFA